MCNSKYFASRVAKARTAAANATIERTDVDGRANLVRVPGTHTPYTVEISRLDHSGLILTTCRNGDACKGNSCSVCYHSMAAFIKAADGKGFVAVCESEEDANRRARLGGKVWLMRSEQSTHAGVWLVLERNRDKALPVEHKPAGSRMWK